MIRRDYIIWTITAILAIVGLQLLGHQVGYQIPLLPSSSRPQFTVASTFDDVDNLQLNSEQCTSQFPDLYLEADRARKYFKGGISSHMVDNAEKDGASARVAIINNKVLACLRTVAARDYAYRRCL